MHTMEYQVGQRLSQPPSIEKKYGPVNSAPLALVWRWVGLIWVWFGSEL
jgi:hypothetical protein